MKDLECHVVADVQARGYINRAHAATAKNGIETIFAFERLADKTGRRLLLMAREEAFVRQGGDIVNPIELDAAAAAKPCFLGIFQATLSAIHRLVRTPWFARRTAIVPG